MIEDEKSKRETRESRFHLAIFVFIVLIAYLVLAFNNVKIWPF